MGWRKYVFILNYIFSYTKKKYHFINISRKTYPLMNFVVITPSQVKALII